jgi:hypothetical protein
MLSACVGCSPADEESMPSCIELSASCAPLYAPIFDELFTRTLQPTCGQGGSSCHGPAGQSGGLSMSDADSTWAELTGQNDARLVPGDPGCSELVVRTHSAGESWSMPPGQPLSEGERCVIRQWIEQGAKR